MEIQKQLPQFENQRVLLIVTSGHKGIFYSAANGVIEKAGGTEDPVEKYSDREGMFGSGGGHIKSGAVYEENKQENLKQFARKVSAEVDRITQEKPVQTVYLFTPDFMIHELDRELNGSLKEKIRETFKGNFVEEHPFKLLEKIKSTLFF